MKIITSIPLLFQEDEVTQNCMNDS